MTTELAIAGAIVALTGGIIPIWIWVRPTVKRSAAVADAILGEEPVHDRAGREIQPARPGLVSRVGSVEHAVALLVETNTRLDNHEGRLDGHEAQIKDLQEQAVERIVGKVDSAAAWGAMEAAIKQDPHPPIEEKP